MSQKPLLRRAGMTGRVFLLTHYKTNSAGMVTAIQKLDITDEYEALVAEDEAARSGSPSEEAPNG